MKRIGTLLAGFAALTTTGAAPFDQHSSISFVNLLSTPALVTLDANPPRKVGAREEVRIAAAPGQHVIIVAPQGGAKFGGRFSLSESTLAEGRHERWWCVVVAPKDREGNSGSLAQLMKDDCARHVRTADSWVPAFP